MKPLKWRSIVPTRHRWRGVCSADHIEVESPRQAQSIIKTKSAVRGKSANAELAFEYSLPAQRRHTFGTKVVEYAFWSQRGISGNQGHDCGATEKEHTYGLFGVFAFEQGDETAA
jgi:hypothetical protein